MNDLIRAGIKRMFRVKTLYVCLAVLFFIGGLDMIKESVFREPGISLPDPGGYLLSGFLAMVLLSAVFITSFLGDEHQYGTLRNKIAAGNDKFRVYVSSFIVCHAAVMIMCGFVWLQTTLLGTLLLGGYTYTAKELLLLSLLSFSGFTMLTALFVLIALCVQSKSIGSVAGVIAAFAIMICGVMTVQVLSVPAFSPDYAGGSRRRLFEFIRLICPVSQMISFSDGMGAESMLISLAGAAVLLASGMILFKNRDLR